MADENRSLHIVVFPWLAFGHMLPFLELSKSLAKRGHKISFISTPRNIQRLPEPPPQVSNLIQFIPLPLPQVPGLPAGAEATSDLPPEEVPYLKKALDSLEQPFRQFIQQTTPKPDWIIQDFVQHWIPKVAAEAGVPCLFLSTLMTASLVFFGPLSEFGEGTSRTTPEQLVAPPPWIPFPSKLCYRLHEARRVFSDAFILNVSGFSDNLRYKIMLGGIRAVAIRSCTEVESDWLKLLPDLYNKPVLPVGLLPPPSTEERWGNQGGDIIEWLDKQRSRSVLYVAFGSEATLSTELLRELARGLELAKLPFVWALRTPKSPSDGNDDLLPEGFEQRTEAYGIVAKGWVPQLKILAHESIGGFLTHSGWSSVIESLQFGHPLVLLPIFADQGLNARVAMEKGIAVEIERDEEDGSFTKEAVAAAVRLAVAEEEGESMRRRAKELREIFVNKEREEKYIDEFVCYLQNCQSKTEQVQKN